MYFYKAYGLHIQSEIELPELQSDRAHATPDLTIKCDEIALPELSETKIFRRGVRALFGQVGNERLFFHWPGIANFEAVNGHTLLVNRITDNGAVLSLFTVSEALGLILFQRGYFLIHASAVNVGNEAWCFIGDPGAGKSTSAAAFVKAGCPLLSDDLTAIYFEKGNAYVLPAFPQLKIWDKTVAGLDYTDDELSPLSEGFNKFAHVPDKLFGHEPVKLAHILILDETSRLLEIDRLSAAEAPTELLRHFPLAIYLLSSDVLRKHFTQSLACYNTASIWKKTRERTFKELALWVKNSVETLNPIALT